METKSKPASLSKGKAAIVLLVFVGLSALIVYGLISVVGKKNVESPASTVEEMEVSSEEEIKVPVNVTLSDLDLTVGVGITKTIEAVGGDSILWSSSNEKVASVFSDGSIKGIGVGHCDITAENEFGRTAQCHVTVKKTVYITIDDCPMGYTGQILKILKKHDVKATFFVMNTYNNRMLKQIQADGHCIGLHTYTHTFKKCYRSQYSYFADLEKLSDIVEGYTGTRPNIIRFPGGTGNHVGGKLNMRRMVNGVEDLGYRAFDWTASSGDATRPRPTSEKAAANALASITADSEILLTHDKPCSPGALEIMIPALKNRGYVFETLDHHPEESHMSPSWYEKTVSKQETPCEALEADNEFLELTVGQSVTMKVTMTPEESTDYVRFVSDTPEVAKVTLEGKITGIKEGVTQVRAIASSGVEAVCSVTVLPKQEENKTDLTSGG